jgi:hypothetical protein
VYQGASGVTRAVVGLGVTENGAGANAVIDCPSELGTIASVVSVATADVVAVVTPLLVLNVMSPVLASFVIHTSGDASAVFGDTPPMTTPLSPAIATA